jgi:tetratricopeptide (TPR) repeat protein
VNWPPLISAGELFELVRPTAVVLSALFSVWILVLARRRRLGTLPSLLWAFGTLLAPIVVMPLFLAVLILSRAPASFAQHDPVKPWKRLLPLAYAICVLSIIGVYLYRDATSVDAHLARASQAKVMSDHARAIREYRAALHLENNAHVHKLLGLELAEVGQPTEALAELRLAEKGGGDVDGLLSFELAGLLDKLGDQRAATREYREFLAGNPCASIPAVPQCAVARAKLREAQR